MDIDGSCVSSCILVPANFLYLINIQLSNCILVLAKFLYLIINIRLSNCILVLANFLYLIINIQLSGAPSHFFASDILSTFRLF